MYELECNIFNMNKNSEYNGYYVTQIFNEKETIHKVYNLMIRIFCKQCMNNTQKCQNKRIQCKNKEIEDVSLDYIFCQNCKNIKVCHHCGGTSRYSLYSCSKCNKVFHHDCEQICEGQCKDCNISTEIEQMRHILELYISHLIDEKLIIKIISIYAIGIAVNCCNKTKKCKNEIVMDSKYDLNSTNRECYKYEIRKYKDKQLKDAVIIFGKQMRIFCSECTKNELKKCKGCIYRDTDLIDGTCHDHYCS
eukprot:430257_1